MNIIKQNKTIFNLLLELVKEPVIKRKNNPLVEFYTNKRKGKQKHKRH